MGRFRTSKLLHGGYRHNQRSGADFTNNSGGGLLPAIRDPKLSAFHGRRSTLRDQWNVNVALCQLLWVVIVIMVGRQRVGSAEIEI